MEIIWATRGRTWDFRFLLDGGHADPLEAYELAFATMRGELAGYRQTSGTVSLRFPDPDDRKDDAGRVIPHDFVVGGTLATEITSFDEGRRKLWKVVGGTYARVWNLPPPTASEVRLIVGDALTRGSF